MKNIKNKVRIADLSITDLLFIKLELQKMMEKKYIYESAMTELTDDFIEMFRKQEGLIISNHLLKTLLYQGYLSEQEFEEFHTELLIIENKLIKTLRN